MVRVRYAPSPTGFLHIGTIRIAVFNWLFARKNNGSFIIRIEDTDVERSSEDYLKNILSGLRWLGIDWDEGPEVDGAYGPYFQSKRQEIYKDYINELINKGVAYRCFCSEEELSAKREEAEKKRIAYKYDRKCLNINTDSLFNSGAKYVVRFKVPEGETVFNDLIRDEVRFSNSTISDFVLSRSDGKATFNFCVVVDDYLMKISHVIRGEDHISNTPKQIMLYNAIDAKIPEFAHIPLTLTPDGAKLSKRSGEASFQKYMDEGFLPDAVLNFIAFLGWHMGEGDTRELLSREELIEAFSLSGISHGSATFSLSKLEWLNGKYIRASSSEIVVENSIPFLINSNLIDYETIYREKDKISKIILLFQERLKKFSEISNLSEYFFLEDINYEEKAVKKFLKSPSIKDILKDVIELLSSLQNFTIEETKLCIEKYISDRGVKAKDIIQPIRVCVTGSDASPPIFEVLSLIGKEKVLKRINFVINILL